MKDLIAILAFLNVGAAAIEHFFFGVDLPIATMQVLVSYAVFRGTKLLERKKNNEITRP